eukprot:1185217-Prorocentrum_minimum.AAC.1
MILQLVCFVLLLCLVPSSVISDELRDDAVGEAKTTLDAEAVARTIGHSQVAIAMLAISKDVAHSDFCKVESSTFITQRRNLCRVWVAFYNDEGEEAADNLTKLGFDGDGVVAANLPQPSSAGGSRYYLSGLRMPYPNSNLNLTAELKSEGRISQKKSQHLSSIAPYWLTTEGTLYASQINEGAAIISLGLAAAACYHRKEYKCVGTAGWKAADGCSQVRASGRRDGRRMSDDCKNLDYIATHDHWMLSQQGFFPGALPEAGLHSFPEDSALYWYDGSPLVGESLTLERHQNWYPFQKRLFTRFFKEVFAMDYEALLNQARTDEGSQTTGAPWSNWFITTTPTFETLAKLHVVLYAWLEHAYPLREFGCTFEFSRWPKGKPPVINPKP